MTTTVLAAAKRVRLTARRKIARQLSLRNGSACRWCEVLSAFSEIALDDNEKPSLHVHVALGLSDGMTCGGHLLEEFVRPTL